jgi:hypothetical protein
LAPGIGIDGNSKAEVVLLKKPGKVKALEDDILARNRFNESPFRPKKFSDKFRARNYG